MKKMSQILSIFILTAGIAVGTESVLNNHDRYAECDKVQHQSNLNQRRGSRAKTLEFTSELEYHSVNN